MSSLYSCISETWHVWCFPTILCRQQLGVLQLNSDTINLELSQSPQVKDSGPQTAFTSEMNCMSVFLLVLWLAKNQRFLQPCPHIWSFARMAHWTQEKITGYYKRIQLRLNHKEEMYRTRCVGKYTELPCSLHVYHFPWTFQFYQPGSSESCPFGVYTET